MKLFIITRCTRQQNLKLLRENIFSSKPKDLEIEWHIVFDSKILKDVDAVLLSDLSDSNTKFHFDPSDGWGLTHLNSIIDGFGDGWVYHLDDDNLLHDDFYETLWNDYFTNIKYKDTLVYIFSQKVGGKDFTGLDVREAIPENVKVRHIDLAQWLIHTKVHNEYNHKYGTGYTADGHFIENVYSDQRIHPYFVFIDKILSNYNYLQKESKPRVPKILYIGEGSPELKSYKWLGYEDDTLDTKYVQDDTSIISDLVEFKPDAIISRSDIGWQHHPNLASMPLQIRRKWIDLKNDYDGDIGELAYNLSMNTMLTQTSLSDEELISFFTPIYNTGDKLWKTYESLRTQTYPNWEWVLMNDSSDGGKTLKIAESIAKLDPRVRVYDFREKSGGIIGEVKWRACCMSRGYLLAELDHDDLLTPGCAMDLYLASKKHPECGFISNESCEVFEDWTSPKYPEGFAFGYGSYREEHYNGKLLNVVVQNGANPKTMRHIVGVPNHVRAWRRDTYFAIGGHNRYLSVADDYELIVRTFLHTRMCVIPKLGYIQFIYNNSTGRNTHDLSRADIQRRVRSISSFYNEKIRDRFEELGVEDWAYKENPTNPLLVASKFGEEEGNVSIFYTES
jgi:glycosyltransferase involved in cell wall biosynthesis